MDAPSSKSGVRATLSWVLVAMTALLAVQGFFAGTLVLTQTSSYDTVAGIHGGVGHTMELAAIGVLVLGFVAKDKVAGFVGIALTVFTGAQNGFIQAAGSVRAFHVVGAFLIVAMTLWLLATRHPWRKPAA